MLPTQPESKTATLRSVLGRVMWRMPFKFGLAKLAGPGYSLRCLLFHDVSDEVSEFTQGLGVTLSVDQFEAVIKFACQYYTPISLQGYLEGRRRGDLPQRPVLVTFDDAYASVALNAAPILHKHKVPAVFFVTASLIGNENLGLDNLMCYVANTAGMGALRSVAHESDSNKQRKFDSLEQIFDDLLPAMRQDQIARFRAALTSSAGISLAELARHAKLYVSPEQLRTLAESGFEIGSHTFSHVFCRSLVDTDFEKEIATNKARLEAASNSRVRAFSVPYGSPVDLTSELASNLRDSKHEVVFLARDRSNARQTDLYQLNRVSMHAGSDEDFFEEIEILPRLRSFADFLLRRNKRLPEARQ